MQLLGDVTRNLLFTGKGGVGKTSVACATAIALADGGKQVLLVSTDPASNLDEVLGVTLGMRPTPVPTVGGLFAMNVDPEQAAKEYRERVVAPYRALLPDSAVKSIEEQLSGACTVEIAAFDEFAKLLGDPATTSSFDHIIFDTAPTGHTLRLLQLPAAWANFIDSSVGGTSCLGPLAGLQAQHSLYVNTLTALSNPALTTVYLVSRPEESALTEAERTRHELHTLGIANHRLILNGIFRASVEDDPVASALEERGRGALQSMPEGLLGLQGIEIPLVPRSLIGVDALRGLTTKQANGNTEQMLPMDMAELPADFVELLTDLSARGRGVIMTMGKGGVGKTTIASQIALSLAGMGHSVHLTTTDPAADVRMAVRDSIPNLRVSRIDPVAETAAYTAEVMADAGRDLDDEGRALLEEDLRSPCTEEIAVFRSFARCVDEGNHGLWLSTRLQPGTLCSCWMPPKPITVMWCETSATSLKVCEGYSRSCGTPTSHGFSSLPCQRLLQFTKQPGCRTICVVPGSPRMHGSSTRVWLQPRRVILCSRSGRLWSTATSLKYKTNWRREWH